MSQVPLDWLKQFLTFQNLETSELSHHENLLLETCQNVLSEIDGCHIYGKTQGKAAVLSSQ